MLKRPREQLSRSRLVGGGVVLILIAAAFVFYIWRLDTLTAGFSPTEAQAIKSNSGWQTIVNYPLNVPQRTLQYLALQVDPESQLAARMPSAAFMALFLGLFYLILKLWFGRFSAVLGSLLLISTPWIALIARSATPDILVLMPIATVGAYLWLTRRNNFRTLAWFGLCLSAALSLYVPGMIWFLLAGGLLTIKSLKAATKSVHHWVVTVGLFVALLVVIPLILAAVEQPAILRDLSLVPSPLRTPLEILKSTAWAILSLFWRLPHTTDFTVGRLPLLSLVQLALAAFGGYALWSKARGVLLWLLAIAGSSILAAGFNNRLTLMLPAVIAACILVAAGLRYLYVEWNTIFPRNPLPRSLALIMMILVVGGSLAYGYRYTLVAWPNSAATKSTYVIK